MHKKIIITMVIIIMGCNYSALAAQTSQRRDGGMILTEEQLSSDALVNPNRDYNFRNHGSFHGRKSVQSITNVDDKFDYVIMEYLNQPMEQDISHIKYLVIHETGNRQESAWATNNFSYFTKQADNSMFIVDQDTVIQTMDIKAIDFAIGNTDFSKTDISNKNSISIEMCVNTGGSYERTVANTVYFAREILKALPSLEIKQHADAFSERSLDGQQSFQKNCPQILREETTWWNWDKFIYFVKNNQLPIPFIDFDPTIEKEVPNELKEYLGYESKSIVDKILEKFNSKNTQQSNFLSEKKVYSSSDIVLDEYTNFDIESNIKMIEGTVGLEKVNQKYLRSLMDEIDFVCKIENVNPNIIVQLMNGYTGYFTFQGILSADENNFMALKDKKGNFISYDTMEDGVLAAVQYYKKIVSKEKVKMEPSNQKAIQSVNCKNIAKTTSELREVLGVSEGFMNNVINRVENL